MRKGIFLSIFIYLFCNNAQSAQDTLVFKGQLSSWINYNAENNLSVWAGGRYIPQLNYSYSIKKPQLLDLEVSANIFGNLGTNFSDPLYSDGQIKPYRAWARYSGRQFEIRAGLQKINFGSAVMLRPLMWFDEMDARDPLNLTDGVWGLLGRYYFLNNANIWLWALYGNKEPRGWEIAQRNIDYPEFGGRFQFSFAQSEIGLTYHHQNIDTHFIDDTDLQLDNIIENKMGFDLKIDWHIGLWFEGVWSKKDADLGMFTNQEMITLGIDYTFGIGNGLYFVSEHLIAANDEKAFEFKEPINFTAASLSYPVGLFDHVNAILYYVWDNKSVYNFINWQKQFNSISVYLMAYWNPENSLLPNQQGVSNLYGGKGIQIMLIFNH